MWQPGERDGESNPNSKLTAAEVREIRRLSQDGLSCAQIATEFAVCAHTVSDIVGAKTWKQIYREFHPSRTGEMNSNSTPFLTLTKLKTASRLQIPLGSITDYAARVESVSMWTLLDTGLRVSEPRSLAPPQVLWQQESPCVSAKGGPYGKQPQGRQGRVVVPAGAHQILD